MSSKLIAICSKCEKLRLKWTKIFGRHFYSSEGRSTVELTRVRYPSLKRGPYGNVSNADISRFKELLPGAERVITEASELTGYNTDWLKTCRGKLSLQDLFVRSYSFCLFKLCTSDLLPWPLQDIDVFLCKAQGYAQHCGQSPVKTPAQTPADK